MEVLTKRYARYRLQVEITKKQKSESKAQEQPRGFLAARLLRLGLAVFYL
jgi:hypothetical protein